MKATVTLPVAQWPPPALRRPDRMAIKRGEVVGTFDVDVFPVTLVGVLSFLIVGTDNHAVALPPAGVLS